MAAKTPGDTGFQGPCLAILPRLRGKLIPPFCHDRQR